MSMEKITINDRARIFLLRSKAKLERLRYPEIPIIFDIKDLQTFEECKAVRASFLNQYQRYGMYGSYVEGAYQDLLYKVAGLIEELRPNPTLQDILYIYVYLVRKGYLSVTGEFHFMYPECELSIRQGLSMVTGMSVCRNLSAMLSDLLYYFNIANIPIMTDRLTHESPEYTITKDYYQLLEDSNKDEFSAAFDEKAKTLIDNRFEVGNHSELLIPGETYTLVDPTIVTISNLVRGKNEFPTLDYLRLWFVYGVGFCDLKSTINLYRTLKDTSLEIIDSKTVIDAEHACFKACEDNHPKIKTFYKKALSSMQYLNDELQCLKEVPK